MKIQVQFVRGARAGQVIDVPLAPVIRFGRQPDNDVAFDPQRDLDASGYHAELRQQPDGFYLHDIGSSNGTWVSGARIQQCKLLAGQQVSFGPNGPILVLTLPMPVAPPPRAHAPAGVAKAPVAPGPAASPSQVTVLAPPGSPLTVGQQLAAKLPPEQKVGARTVAMMIDSAMGKARQDAAGGLGKSTVFVKSLVNQAVRRSTVRFKITVLILGLLLLSAVGGFVVLRYVENRGAEAEQLELRRQMAALMEQQKGASGSEKMRLAGRLDAMNQQLAQNQPPSSGREIVKRNAESVFLLAFTDALGSSKGYCSAFAVRARVLGTNAHCIVALEGYRRAGMRMFAVMNRAPRRRYGIKRVTHHPAYHKPRDRISPDVGLIEVDETLPSLVELASDPQLKSLDSGDIMYMYGFPGRLANVSSPAATLVQGVIGRVTGLDGSLGKFEDNVLVQHSAFTSGGTSGSPIFGENGKVIAVNTGGYVEPGTMQVVDPSTGKAGNLMVAKQLAGYNFGIRIDVLRKLLVDLGQ